MKLNKRSSEIERELLGAFARAREVFVSKPGDITRLLSLRPSQLPFCPAKTFINAASRGAVMTQDFRSSFYTSVGTAVHEVLQTYLGKSGRFLADWECKCCGKWNRLSHKNECCDLEMQYHEVTINYRGVVGHIDGIYRDSKGRYWIVDFKTASVAGVKSKRTSPGKVYIEQVETYANCLYRQHGIRCEGVTLFFVPRDNPNNPTVWTYVMDDDDYSRVVRRTKKYLRWHAQTLNVRTLDEALALAEYGRCVSTFCNICKSSVSLKKQLKQAFKLGKAANRLPLIDYATRVLGEKRKAKRSK